MSKIFKVLTMMLAAVLVLSACSSGGGSKGKSDETLDLQINGDIPTMDSAMATDGLSFDMFFQTMEGLYTLDKDDKAIPAVAKGDPKITNDGKKWTIKLRDDAKWSNGDPVTAHDFVFAWRKVVDPDTASEYAYILYDIKNAEEINSGDKKPEELGVKAVDDHTLEFELTKSLPYYKELLSFGTFMPQNEKFVKKQGDKYGTTVKTTLYNGPFKMTEWKTDDKVTLEKNDDYWDKDKVKLNKVNYKVVKEASTAVNLYETNKLDIVDLPAEQVKKYKDDKAFNTELDTVTYYFKLNEDTVPEFKNEDFRLAFAKAIDKEAYVKNNLNNGSIPTDNFVPKDFVKDSKGKEYQDGVKNTNQYNVKEAKEHYEKAKKALGKDNFTIELMTYDKDTAKRDAEYFKEQLEKNLDGVTIKIKQQPFKQKLDLVSKGEYEMSLENWIPDYPDPMTFLELYVTDGSHNNTGWSNKEYDSIIKAADSSLASNPDKRLSELQRAESMLLNEAGIVPLYQVGVAQLQKPNVKNVVNHQFGGVSTLKEAYIEK
ncbi:MULTISPECIES: peptide ABC transporter substrate-binding protein [Mammaliicoccus]|uniref:Periplasmic oligopeptide-binding protein OppA n=1 Tax=Mammaliicoccus sciuri TaxID=1296 RepID=A0AB37HN95_MAMSC|nr:MULTISPECIES: peptide ABC transporter substrate-binding protein [Mammaliicoccus]ARB41175.1 peptide ABC transporter substrate-binding protein [Mammaliicoccus sciuri]MDT0669086.1 peptide ABC transporter substrate-binding protein [Mammaliicoccus sciuri]MDT0710818.1 peptide ABC transporter substrate-binding protein [Mammaliicoccus sciuri]MEB6215012.1 peptide ABC transporter substrate-binding protein [Mammaliicoccus sciuri]MEB6255389.1 peptide ABC transporter substrate-binding protein [Mammaliic